MTQRSGVAMGVAKRLVAARQSLQTIGHDEVRPATLAAAYEIQDAVIALIGPAGGWKVGAPNAQAEPMCARLPRADMVRSGMTLAGERWRLRGIEVEVALRVACDLRRPVEDFARDEIAAAFDAVFPVMEIVETRLADHRDPDPLLHVADLQYFGGLVVGAPSRLAPAALDLRTIDATLKFDGVDVVRTLGGHPGQDVGRLLFWLARHAAQRGHPLEGGQIITTGTCTGVVYAPPGTHVEAELLGLGSVEITFQP